MARKIVTFLLHSCGGGNKKVTKLQDCRNWEKLAKCGFFRQKFAKIRGFGEAAPSGAEARRRAEGLFHPRYPLRFVPTSP